MSVDGSCKLWGCTLAPTATTLFPANASYRSVDSNPPAPASPASVEANVLVAIGYPLEFQWKSDSLQPSIGILVGVG